MKPRNQLMPTRSDQVVATRPLRWGGEYQQIIKMVPLRDRMPKKESPGDQDKKSDDPKTLLKGKKGGMYYLSKSGKKIYAGKKSA